MSAGLGVNEVGEGKAKTDGIAQRDVLNSTVLKDRFVVVRDLQIGGIQVVKSRGF